MMSGRALALLIATLSVTALVGLANVARGSRGNGGGVFSCDAPVTPLDVTHDPPSQTLLGMLAPLRRPATADDAAPLDRLFLPDLGGVEVDYIRLVRRLGGVRHYLVPAQRQVYPLPDSCIDKLPPGERRAQRRLKRLLDQHPQEQIVVTPVRVAAARARPALAQFFSSSGPGCGVSGTADELKTLPLIATCSGQRARISGVIGLLSDGVAQVRVFYPRKVEGRKQPFP